MFIYRHTRYLFPLLLYLCTHGISVIRRFVHPYGCSSLSSASPSAVLPSGTTAQIPFSPSIKPSPSSSEVSPEDVRQRMDIHRSLLYQFQFIRTESIIPVRNRGHFVIAVWCFSFHTVPDVFQFFYSRLDRHASGIKPSSQ